MMDKLKKDILESNNQLNNYQNFTINHLSTISIAFLGFMMATTQIPKIQIFMIEQDWSLIWWTLICSFGVTCLLLFLTIIIKTIEVRQNLNSCFLEKDTLQQVKKILKLKEELDEIGKNKKQEKEINDINESIKKNTKILEEFKKKIEVQNARPKFWLEFSFFTFIGGFVCISLYSICIIYISLQPSSLEAKKIFSIITFKELEQRNNYVEK